MSGGKQASQAKRHKSFWTMIKVLGPDGPASYDLKEDGLLPKGLIPRQKRRKGRDLPVVYVRPVSDSSDSPSLSDPFVSSPDDSSSVFEDSLMPSTEPEPEFNGVFVGVGMSEA